MRDWTRLDAARRVADLWSAEVTPDWVASFDTLVTEYRIDALDSYGLDLTDPDVLFDHWSSITLYTLAANQYALMTCGAPHVCYAGFHTHTDHAVRRTFIILRELAKTAGAPPITPEQPSA